MVVIFLIIVSIFPFYVDQYSAYIKLEPIFLSGIVMIFPLIYFYVRSVTFRTPLSKKDGFHLLPALLILLTSIITMLKIPGDKRIPYIGMNEAWINSGLQGIKVFLLAVLGRIIFFCQAIYYFLVSHRLIQEHRKRISDYFSDLNKYYFNWIRIWYLTYPGASIVGFILLLMGNTGLDMLPQALFAAAFFILSGVFYMISYIAMHQRYIENGEFYNQDTEPSAEISFMHIPAGLEAELQQYFQNEKPYLDPDLKITDVASRLKTNRTYISYLIRTRIDTNFSGFVNSHRVEEAISMFGNPAYRNYTTKSISEAAGFNNYNSFSKAFFKMKGMTPAYYRDKI